MLELTGSGGTHACPMGGWVRSEGLISLSVVPSRAPGRAPFMGLRCLSAHGLTRGTAEGLVVYRVLCGTEAPVESLVSSCVTGR